jgi:hypothetical protein
MNKIMIIIALQTLATFPAQSATRSHFDTYFTNQTMRIDYHHTGHANEEILSIDRIYQQGTWAGNPDRPIDPFNNGRYQLKVYTEDLSKLIYSKGFDSYFGEYQTTAPAIASEMKTFHESVLIPYPVSKIMLTFEKRNKNGQLNKVFERVIDPHSVNIIKESLIEGVKVFKLMENGHPHKKVDLVILAEGYTKSQEAKLKKDLNRTTQALFSAEPFKSNKKNFNVYGAFLPSQEAGCDEPRRGIFKNTSISASFNSLGLARYMLTENNRALRDVAAHVPYDTIMIMVNSNRYGGGGIYNFFAAFTADNSWHPYVVVHEFGHSFAGLADEYYSANVAYNDFYPRGIEPTEPNITALLNPNDLKWKHLVDKSTGIPTPWNKEAFDKLSSRQQKARQQANEKIARLSRNKADKNKIVQAEKASEQLSEEHAKQVDKLLAKDPMKARIGAFLGAGYSSQGLYRPMTDCIMFSKGRKPFCRVCQEAIQRVIDHFTQ